MEVRLRHASWAKGATLADIPFRGDVIDKVIPIITEWGLTHDATDQSASMYGQFVAEENEAYFEVVFGSED